MEALHRLERLVQWVIAILLLVHLQHRQLISSSECRLLFADLNSGLTTGRPPYYQSLYIASLLLYRFDFWHILS
jgi:hypothetical protein